MNFVLLFCLQKDEKTASIYKSELSEVYSIEKTLINFLNKEELKKLI